MTSGLFEEESREVDCHYIITFFDQKQFQCSTFVDKNNTSRSWAIFRKPSQIDWRFVIKMTFITSFDVKLNSRR